MSDQEPKYDKTFGKDENYKACFVFDWDDSLFPSSFFSKNVQSIGQKYKSFETYSEGVKAAFWALGLTVRCVLENAKSLGDVIIVTSAQAGWVELCVKTHFIDPDFQEFFKTIKVVSARTQFETSGKIPVQSDPLCPWLSLSVQYKMFAFHELFMSDLQQPRKVQEVISIGDSMAERFALWLVCKGQNIRREGWTEGLFPKTIKMIDRPSIEQLIEQLKILNSLLKDFICHVGDLNLDITEKDLQITKNVLKSTPAIVAGQPVALASAEHVDAVLALTVHVSAARPAVHSLNDLVDAVLASVANE